MSKTLSWLPDLLSDTFRGRKGFQVDIVEGAKDRASYGDFDPIGVMNHHTGKGSYEALLRYMSVGSRISPLSQIATSRPLAIRGILTVRITIMAMGRCNHAGVGYLPSVGHNGGNKYLIGIENQNDGYQPWPAQQLEAIHLTTAALLKQLRQGVDQMFEHKTYTSRKVDRHSVRLSDERKLVNSYLQSMSLDLGEIMAEKRLAAIDNSNARYELVDDPNNPGRYALRSVPNPAVAELVTNDPEWRDKVVRFTPRQLESVRVL